MATTITTRPGLDDSSQATNRFHDVQNTSTRSLDTLPVEIIRQIANITPVASVFALSATNRALREACNDWSVLVNLSDCNAPLGSGYRRCQCSTILQNLRVRCLAKLDLESPKALFNIDVCTSARLASTAQSLHSLIADHSESSAR